MGVEDHVAAMRDGTVVREPGALPPHYPTCFGCGPQAEAGLHLVVRREVDEVATEVVFAGRHTGAPGIAHGGVVSAVCDDVLGFTLFLVQEPAVTRRLEVDFLRPVLVDQPYAVRARVDRREGRKLFSSCEGTGPDGVVAFRGTGLFIVVPLTHFAVPGGDGQGPIGV